MMTADWQATVRPIVEETLRTQAVAGMVVGYARGATEPEFLVAGADAAGRPLSEASLFPVASVTKLATALAIHRLADAGALTVEDALERHLPEATAAGGGIRLRRLLPHTAGLVGDYPSGDAPWALGLTWPDIARALLAVRPELPLGAQVH
jgi:CubicO group peptidase (beta-lactamase class C family)